MDHGAAAAGLLLAAGPAGAILGMVLLTRLVRPERRLLLLGPLAVVACGALVGTPLMPGIAATCVLWAVSGLFSAFQVPANAEYVRTVPDVMRGQAFGAASSAVRASQGLGVVAAGLAADHLVPAVVIAIFGAVGACFALWLAVAWSKETGRDR
jgi:MFS family permease